jgi:hypothetical protein
MGTNRVLEIIKIRGGVVEGNWSYVDAKHKFLVVCSAGHEFRTCWNYLLQKVGC